MGSPPAESTSSPVPEAQIPTTLGDGCHRKLQGLIKCQQGPNDELFVREEVEAQRGVGAWPRSQGKSDENPGIGHMAPGGSGGPRKPVRLQNWMSPESPSPVTNIKCFH